MKPILLVVGLFLLLGGCASDPALMDRSATLQYTAPITNAEGISVGAPSPADWEIQAIETYHDPVALANKHMAQREFRDSVLYRELAADDDHFGQYVRALRTERAGGNISADLATIILNGLGVVTGGVETKRTLAALAGGVTGAKGSVEKELFNAEAMTAIVSRMKAARLQALVPIEAGLRQSVGDYPLERGLRDLRAYAEAGTLSGTLAAITNDAGDKARAAQNEIRTFTRDAVYRDAAPLIESLQDGLDGLTDQQAMAMAFLMQAHLPERPKELQDALGEINPSGSRFKDPAAARGFLFYWLEHESGAPDILKQWSDALALAKKG